MDRSTAQQIGSQWGLALVTTGTLIAYLIPATLFTNDGKIDWLWILDWDYWFNLFIGLGIFFFLGYYFGKKAGYQILIKKRNPYLIGVSYSLLTLFCTAFLCGWTGFFQEGIDDLSYSITEPFVDYIVKPLYWISLFGFLPALICGLFFGKGIQYCGNKKLLAPE